MGWQRISSARKSLLQFLMKMKALGSFAFALVAGANAIVTRWAPCCFHLSASGAVTGTVGQLDDGQNRINGPLAPAQFCIADGAITDAHGRGCIITRKSLLRELTLC